MNTQEKPAFPYHILLNPEDICNYTELKNQLVAETLRGERLVLFGRRNTGKTSLVRSVIIPNFRKKHKNSLVVFCDFLGCRTLSQLDDRIRLGFQEGFSRSYPVKNTFLKMFQLIQSLRPSFEADPTTGELRMTVEVTSSGATLGTAEKIIQKIGEIHSSHRVLLVFDEFQDIAFISEAEARLRRCLQELPSNLSVIVLGSKKHLLSAMFSKPKAPFASWGLPVEIPPIHVQDYTHYINTRLKPYGQSISKECVSLLMERMQGIPESINIVCSIMTTTGWKGSLDKERIERGIQLTLDRFQSTFYETLSQFTEVEQRFLISLAKLQPLLQPRGKEFVSASQLASATIGKQIRHMEDEAVIYRLENGYVLADPLLAVFLKSRM